MKAHPIHASAVPPPIYEGTVIMASASPRRRELLAMIVPDYQIAPTIDVDETFPADTAPTDVSVLLSQIKSNAYKALAVGDAVVITADTVVICDGQILGKPADNAEAISMLRTLSGKTHTVVTGITLRTCNNTYSFAEKTLVTFRTLDNAEIEEYVARFRPLDKAGAYGIQEWIGCVGITGIEGDFYNVMGLPLESLYTHLRALNQN